ncbi:alpha/beta hydrolase [Psychrobacter sp. AH5]|uniref:alpha/beta fold hydrolase n=1 Tax=Psychrobacter sp. AH5 TaxID=2937433 RepID=UPI0033416B05
MITETLKLVTTRDNEQVAVWKVTAAGEKSTTHRAHKAQNIFLTHGTFSDKKVCLGIASYLCQLGHTCYVMEWRGHGHSSSPTEEFNFETVATYDYEATFCYLFDELKLDNLHCVTHSGGGVGLAMFLVQYPDYIDKINSISTFACQAYGAVTTPIRYTQILALKLVTKLLGYIPAKKLGLGPFNESYYTMSQWYDWNLQKNFKSSFLKDKDKNQYFDYRAAMVDITPPVYAISGKGDRFVSPTRGCKLFFDNFGNADNVFIEYSLANSHLEDYDHTRVLMSRHSSNEIWPTVAAWIDNYAS